MKIHYYLIAFAMSSMAWAEQDAASPAAGSAADATANTEMQTSEESTGAKTQQAADMQATVDAEEQAGFSRGSVVRSVFTTGIEEREPVDKLGDAQSEQENIYYFTELRDMSGQTATHRWEHDGKVMAEVKFDVRGPRWRVWSSKTFTPNLEGEWKVSVLNGAGEVISEDIVNYSHTEEMGAPPAGSEQPAQQQQGSDSIAPISEPMQQ